MSWRSKQARTDMRAKIARLIGADPSETVDASGYRPPDPLDAEVKTGLRPVSRRQYKSGGYVTGAECLKHAGRKPRKSGGSVANALANQNIREANEEREGSKHIGGFKRGGKAHRAAGGADENAGDMVPTSRMAFQPAASRMEKAAGLKKGGRAHKGDGGMLALLSPAAAIAQDPKNAKYLSPALMAAGLKRGGRAHRDLGGILSVVSPAAALASALLKKKDKDSDSDTPSLPSSGSASGMKKGGKALKKGMSVSDGKLEGTRPTGGRLAHAKGGKADKWEGSERDEREDKKLAKKHHMSSKEWECSKMDEKHDRAERKRGGRAGKGKTNINIIIGAGHGDQAKPVPMPIPMPPPGMAGPPPGGAPPAPPPGGPGGLPPGLAAMMGGGPPAPPPGAGAAAGLPPPPMSRRRGGRAGYPHMTAGAGGGEGRLEKIREYGRD